MSVFRFKQFEIKQDKTAMKVGTDGVLLGSWADLSKAKYILDIGAGTGLITLMCAQRSIESNAKIIGIEIDKDASLQCIENVEASKWNKQISIKNLSLQEYSTNQKFNLIISNPPFFQNSLKTNDQKKNLARHTDSLSFEELLRKTAKLLSDSGKANFIIPYNSEENFLKIANEVKLYPIRICRVRGNINSEIKRSLIELSFDNNSNISESEMSVEISRHNYTEKYINLTKDFYLKM